MSGWRGELWAWLPYVPAGYRSMVRARSALMLVRVRVCPSFPSPLPSAITLPTEYHHLYLYVSFSYTTAITITITITFPNPRPPSRHYPPPVTRCACSLSYLVDSAALLVHVLIEFLASLHAYRL